MMTETMTSKSDLAQTSGQFSTFYVGDLFFGVDVLHVQEVLCFQPMTSVPQAPEVIEGLINLRGQIVTAIDMRRRLRRSEEHTSELQSLRHLVCRLLLEKKNPGDSAAGHAAGLHAHLLPNAAARSE